jgi:hypothetical protein
MTAIDTKRVTGRRATHFPTIAMLCQDLDVLARAQHAGRLRPIGNWVPGQVFSHLASWIDFAYDGFPMRAMPLPVRLVGRMFLRRYLARGFPVGLRLPGVAAGTYALEPAPFDEGLENLRKALTRLEQSPPLAPSPMFGRLTHGQWKQLHLRHAELHLSFLTIVEARAQEWAWAGDSRESAQGLRP